MKNKNQIRHRASQVSDNIKSLDFFRKPIPGFNIEGKAASEGTLLGTLVSVLLIIVMLLYGAVKFDILVNMVNPSITVSEQPN